MSGNKQARQQQRTVFSKQLLRWYEHSEHRLMPWQKNKTAYRVWVSEIMLQQTQVSKVIDYFNAFVNRFPSLKKLASAKIDEVLEQWAGLGYYHRAHKMHHSAKIIHHQHHGRFPRDLPGLLALPGIGRSTAGAILALAFGKRYAVLDGNVQRVVARYCDIAGWPGHAQVAQQLWQEAESLLPQHSMADYTQAIMELGATICTPSNAQCSMCPVRPNCCAYHKGTIEQRPAAAPYKKEKQVCRWLMLFICYRDRVLLERRPQQGIWAGLLCPPQSHSRHDARQQLRRWGIHQAPVQGKTLLHELSHRRLFITPWWLQLSEQLKACLDSSFNWYKINPAAMAVPAAVKKLLLQLKSQQEECRPQR